MILMIPLKYKEQLIKIINKRYGLNKELWLGLQPETKRILYEEAGRLFKQSIIARYGSISNYWQDQLRKLGYKNDYEYRQELVKRRGYPSYYDYLNECAKRAGFDNYTERMRDRLNKRGFTFHTYRKYLAQKNNRNTELMLPDGFKTMYEYQMHLVKKRGFKTTRQYRIYLLKEGEVIENENGRKITKCPFCGWISDKRKGKTRECKQCGKMYKTIDNGTLMRSISEEKYVKWSRSL